MNNDTTQPREQASPDTLWRIKFPDGAVAVIDSKPADYMQPYATAYRIAPVAAPEAQKAVAIVTGSSVQWLEGAGKLADRAPLYATPVAAPEAPTRTKLRENHNDDGDIGWYFDCDGHYIDVERNKDGKYSVYFRNRADQSEAWLDQAGNASTGAAPEAPARNLELENAELRALLAAQSATRAIQNEATTASASFEKFDLTDHSVPIVYSNGTGRAPAPSRNAAPLPKPVVDGVDEAAFQYVWEYMVDGTDTIDAGWLRRFVTAYREASESSALAEQYSDMLRKICFEYSAGGYNSEGLMSPEAADAKIRWVIDDTRRAALTQQSAAQPCPTCGGSKVDPGGLPICRGCGGAAQESHAGADTERLEVFIDWYLRAGTRAEINPDGHITHTTRDRILAWLDRSRAAMSAATKQTEKK